MIRWCSSTTPNSLRDAGQPPADAVRLAAVRRFRPIVLTTLTTFGGLAPMIFETSLQAKFMIPMAISLGFGILFATGITLGLVPCFYVIIEDAKAALARRLGRDREIGYVSSSSREES